MDVALVQKFVHVVAWWWEGVCGMQNTLVVCVVDVVGEEGIKEGGQWAKGRVLRLRTLTYGEVGVQGHSPMEKLSTVAHRADDLVLRTHIPSLNSIACWNQGILHLDHPVQIS